MIGKYSIKTDGTLNELISPVQHWFIYSDTSQKSPVFLDCVSDLKGNYILFLQNSFVKLSQSDLKI